jgi:tripartite-type tricarboxylate transporter receptor subunit TctC
MTHVPDLSRRRLMLAGGAALALPAGRALAAADIGGGKPITLLVSYPAGGGADVMARLIAPRIADALGQPVIVENKPGASGTIAAGQVARATPDGTTLLVDASSYAVNPALFDKLPYDTAKAFSPLAVLALFPNVLVCTASFEARSLADVLRLARAQPGRLAYASSGNGSAQHLAGALFESMAKVDLTHVPYRGVRRSTT